MFLLDTHVISELRKPQADTAVVAWASNNRPGSRKFFMGATSVVGLMGG